MLWTIAIILLILWLLGFSFHVGGTLIHLILVIAVVVVVLGSSQDEAFKFRTGKATRSLTPRECHDVHRAEAEHR